MVQNCHCLTKIFRVRFSPTRWPEIVETSWRVQIGRQRFDSVAQKWGVLLPDFELYRSQGDSMLFFDQIIRRMYLKDPRPPVTVRSSCTMPAFAYELKQGLGTIGLI